MYLLDTDVLSLLRRQKKFPDIADWFADRPLTDFYISVVSLAEIETGLVKARRRTPEFAGDLYQWTRRLPDVDFADRILPMTTEVARAWGQMAARIGNSENDLMIAATAQVHGLTVVTRNVRHFEPTGVPVIDPSGTGRG